LTFAANPLDKRFSLRHSVIYYVCKGTKFLSHWEILKKLFLQKSTLQQKKVLVVTRLNAEKCFINFFRVPSAVIVLSSLSTFSGMSSTISGK